MKWAAAPGMAMRAKSMIPRPDELRQTFRDVGIPIIPEDDILVKKEIGRGGFGTVVLGKLKSDNCPIVVKQMVGYDSEVTKLFIKEIKFLGTVRHPNMVQLKGACITPLCPILEFVEFDLNKLEIPELNGLPRGHNLREFLDILSDNELVETVGIRLGLLHKAGADVAKGLAFLHSKDICHRDMKPGNVLVANQRRSLVCKLTDFGEARSPLIQTQSDLRDVTQDVKRGTTVFCAPEQLLQDLVLADFESLKKIDVWAYGMILFCIMNPDLKYPWQYEMGQRCSQYQIFIEMKARRLPRNSGAYSALQGQMGLLDIYKMCCCYNRHDRPDIDVVMDAFHSQLFEGYYPRNEVTNSGGSGDSGFASRPVTPNIESSFLAPRPRKFERSPPSPTEGALVTVLHKPPKPEKKIERSPPSPVGGALVTVLHKAPSPSQNDNLSYDNLKLLTRIGRWGDGPSYLRMPHGACARDGIVFIADSGKSRLVAFHQPDPAAKYQYLCHVDMEYPFGCVVSRDNIVYVSCMRKNCIMEVKFDAGRGQMEVTKTLEGGGRLQDPRGLALDPQGRYVYVACQDGVQKVSIMTDSVVCTVRKPEELESFPWGVALVGHTLLVSYPTDKALVLYANEFEAGTVLRVKGLQRPRGLGSDGTNFLVSDYKGESLFIVDAKGEAVCKITSEKTWPMDVMAADDLIYFVDVKNHRILVLGR